MVGIETSQHVKLNYQIAGIGERVLAYVLDLFFIGAFYIVSTSAISLIQDFMSDDAVVQSEPAMWTTILVTIIPVFFYHLIIEILWKGYSLGKKIVGIRVVKIDGTRPEISAFLLRWMFRLVEITFTSGMVAFVTILVNGKGQRLGDIVAKTCVIKERKKIELDETLFAELDDSYEPVFRQVIELNDKDVGIIRSVIDSKKDYEHDNWFVMLQRTAKLIEEKLGISRGDMNALTFLETVIKDYNALHGEG